VPGTTIRAGFKKPVAGTKPPREKKTGGLSEGAIEYRRGEICYGHIPKNHTGPAAGWNLRPKFGWGFWEFHRTCATMWQGGPPWASWRGYRPI